jgi:WD40 repeat protein
MSATKTCPRCGKPLAEDAPQGLCPACLLQAGLSEDHRREPAEFSGATLSAPTVPPTQAAPDRSAEAIGAALDQTAVGSSASVQDAPTIGLNGDGPAVAPLGTVRYFGDYELTSEVARGGMGVVYRARQVSLNRTVALKLILSSQLASEADVKRFHVEAEAAANLDHPNIVPIYEVGVHQGQHYFSMKLIEGESLAGRIGDLLGDPKAAGRLLATVARAVHRAHQGGIIHRDLKPSNILIDRDGQPHVTDFGLAKRIEADSGLTQSGAIMGTPSYMPPEQAGGRKGQLTTAVDIYALGAILYELLTGRPPFRADSVMDTLIQVLEQEPPRPRSLNPRADRDLETIALKCLEKDPARRYGSAEALAEDLERWLRNEPIRARPVSPLERGVKWVKRRPAIAALSLALAILAIGGLAGVLLQWRRAEEARRLAIQKEATARIFEANARTAQADARTAHAEADKNRELAALQEQYRYFNLIKMADRYVRASNVAQAEHFLEACPPALRAWEWGYLKRLLHPEQRSFVGEGAQFSPDGRFLGIDDGPKATITLLDTQTWATARVFQGLGSPVACFAFSPDGQRLAAAGHDKTIKVWEVADGRELATLKGHTGDWVVELAFAPGGKLLASAGARANQVQGGAMADEVRIWDIAQAKLVRAIPDAGHSVAFSPDGTRLAVCTERTAKLGGQLGIVGGALQVLDAQTGQAVWSMPGDGWSEKELHYSPDGKRLATSHGRSGEVRIRDAASGKLLQTLRGHKDAVACLAFSGDGKRLATGGSDQSVKIWDLNQGRELIVYHGHTGAVGAVTFTPDGKTLATAGADRTVRIWDATAEPGTRVLPTSEGGAVETLPSPDGKHLAVVRRRLLAFDLSLVEAESGRLGHTLRSFLFFQGYSRDIRRCFSADGMALASTDGKNLVQVWDVATGRERASFRGHSQQVMALAFSPDGRTLVSADSDKTIKLWDVATARAQQSLQGELSPLALAFSPDGRRLTVAGYGRARYEKTGERSVRVILPGRGTVWDLAAARALFPLPDHDSQTVAVAFSPDGTRIATASWDGTAKIADAASGKELHHLGGHTGYVWDVAFSPDGRRLATGGTDETIKLWDPSTGQEVLELNASTVVSRLQFSPDGQQLVAYLAGQVKLWDSAPWVVRRGAGSTP